ncbi:hypothetical protein VrSk94_33710 [Vibrio rotiferianus]
MKENSKLYRVDYYVRADNGVTNFFSTSGKRIFYNPKKGVGVFHGKEGDYCGVLARIENKYQLVLTEIGKNTTYSSIMQTEHCDLSRIQIALMHFNVNKVHWDLIEQHQLQEVFP